MHTYTHVFLILIKHSAEIWTSIVESRINQTIPSTIVQSQYEKLLKLIHVILYSR